MSVRSVRHLLQRVVLGILVFLFLGSSVALTIPIGNISNGSGNAESDVATLDFGGTLKARFSSSQDIRPGEREVVAIAVAVCDAGTVVNKNVSILPSIVSGTPAIAGGLAALPCVALGGSDGLHTGVNGAVVTFSGPLAQFMGTVRMYADLNFNGVLFEGGDLVEQTVPMMQGTGEAIAQFGGRQGQFMATSSGQPLIAPDIVRWVLMGAPFQPNMSAPRIILFTVDIDSSSGGGRVDVALGLQVGDDTAQGIGGFCYTSLPVPPAFRLNCGSNLLGQGPETTFFNITGSGGGSTGPAPTPTPTPTPTPGGSNLKAFDSNGNCKLDDAEFFSMIDGWIASSVSNPLFFSGVDAWIGQSSVCTAAAAATLDGITLSLRPSPQTALFEAHGQNIASMDVEVFSLNGNRIYAGATSGSLLAWNLRASNGHPLANGTYLYRVIVRGANGEVTQSQVKRLVVLR
jgi:hypothetical protein